MLIDRILEAHAAIRPTIQPTPLHHSPTLSRALGCDVLLKLEHLHPTGSFKPRGAVNALRLLPPAQRDRGVITASTGNHGQAVAWAAARLGVPATVHVAAATAPPKLAGIRALGAELVLVDGPPLAAELSARAAAARSGRPYISPYNDPDIVAGQGTIGAELAAQDPALDAVCIAVGGGGLIAGTGTALKSLSPRTQVVGVWPEASPCLLRALEAGHVVDTEERPTLSDATAGAIEPGTITLPLCRSAIDRTLTIPEPAIADALRALARAEHWMLEGAAALAFAGLSRLAQERPGARLAAILCGRNIDPAAFARLLAHP